MKTDTRGIDALSGHLDGNVLPPVVWDQMLDELGDVPSVPHIEPFDEQPWLALPTMEDLEQIWSAGLTLDSMIFKLALDAHGDGPDLMEFLATQRQLAELELAWMREAEHADHGTGSVEHEPVGAVEAGGGGADFPGGPQDGVAVEQGGQASGDPDIGGASAVPRRGGAGKAARRR